MNANGNTDIRVAGIDGSFAYRLPLGPDFRRDETAACQGVPAISQEQRTSQPYGFFPSADYNDSFETAAQQTVFTDRPQKAGQINTMITQKMTSFYRNKLIFIALILSFLSAGCGGGSGSGGSGQSSISLPGTGQVASYGTNDDGALRKGVAWPSPRFVDNNNGTVTDNLTGLVWLKQVNCYGTMNWPSALSAANSLSTGTCGLADGSQAGDWRVPNVSELESLVSIAALNPALPDNPFPAIAGGSSLSSAFWSSTTFAGLTVNAWFVSLDTGYLKNASKKNLLNLLAVRDGRSGTVRLPATGQTRTYGPGDDGSLKKGTAWPVVRFIDNRDGTVTDRLTGLIWLKNANCLDETVAGATMMNQLGLMKWTEALAWTGGLGAGSCGLADGSTPGDWRLPNRKELMSLIDRSRANPALPAGHPFEHVQSYGYWSSSSLQTYDGKPYSEMAWFVYGEDGVVIVNVGAGSRLVGLGYVWPVRDPVR
jgi:hypothetical protein